MAISAPHRHTPYPTAQMLFDLRSRRRQTTVRIVYVFLALVMGGGLILVGVGTGTGGGLLNAFTNNGSGGSNANPLITKQVKAAVKATEKNPESASAWKSLMNARLSEAQTSANYNSTKKTYTASGKKALNNGIAAWKQYLKVTGNKPDVTAAELARSMYQALGDYVGMASAYQYITKLEPKLAGAYTCLAYTAYAGSASQLGDLAAAKAVALAPKLQKLSLKQNFSKAKKTVSTAQTYVATYC